MILFKSLFFLYAPKQLKFFIVILDSCKIEYSPGAMDSLRISVLPSSAYSFKVNILPLSNTL